MIFFEAPPLGYAVQWSVGVGAAGAPVAIRRGSRFIAPVVVVDKAQIADGLPCHVKLDQLLRINSIQFKTSLFGLLCQFS